MELLHTSLDRVIKSSVSIGTVDYGFALENLHPLIDRFDQQRKLQSRKFYERLRRDILRGCMMPAITVAFVNPGLSRTEDSGRIRDFVLNNVEDGYILDGLQRLNTLKRASESEDFNADLVLPVNLIVAERYDFLLYRMITLNNGQKPMTARHQIEMLTSGAYNIPDLQIEIITEKETEARRPRGAFRRGDISEAYIAFMSDSLHNQNARIIETKLDEILVNKIMETKVFDSDISFEDILRQVSRLSRDECARDWLRLSNNLIGFSVAAKESFDAISRVEPGEFAALTSRMDEAFDALDQSKVNVGKFRREFSHAVILKIENLLHAEELELVEVLDDLSM